MKGIVLAGGKGTRLYPNTLAVTKQLLPIYDKPLIYYPLSLLLYAGVRNILIITNPPDMPAFQRLLGDGGQWGVDLQYAEQAEPRGLADAFRVGRDFIAGGPVCLVLGDNLLYGPGLEELLERSAQRTSGAKIFAYQVDNPQDFGVVELNEDGQILSLEEKPSEPKSRFAIPGLYFYDATVSGVAADLKPSARGELEITDLNRLYLRQGQLEVEVLQRGTAWLDAGTPSALLQAANFVHAVQERQGGMIGCPEEIALGKGFIDADQIMRQAERLKGTKYGTYLRTLLDSP